MQTGWVLILVNVIHDQQGDDSFINIHKATSTASNYPLPDLAEYSANEQAVG